MFISTYTSGACAGSPGPMGIGCAFYENTGNEFDLVVEHKGDGTPLEAEYHALIRALERAQDFLATQVDSYVSCERLAKQITGEWGVKDEKLLPLFLEVMDLMESFKDGFSITWVPHAENAWAERLSLLAIESRILNRRRPKTQTRPSIKRPHIII